MKGLKVLLLIAIIGLSLGAGTRLRSSAVDKSSWGLFDGIKDGFKDTIDKVKDGVTDAKDKVKDGVTDATDRVKDGVTTVIDKTKDAATSVMSQTRAGINNMIQYTQNGINIAIDQAKNFLNIALDKTKEAVVNTAIKNGLLLGATWTKNQVLKAVDQSKKAFVTFGKLTEGTSKQFIQETKAVALKSGKLLDPSQIKVEHVQIALKAIRLATGPLQVALDNPLVAAAMAKCPLKVQIAYKVAVLGVKCINEPEKWQEHLFAVHPVSECFGRMTVNIINDPDNWQEHVIEAGPGIGEMLMKVASMSFSSGKSKLEERIGHRKLMKHFTHQRA